jgi:hypothetical protein
MNKLLRYKHNGNRPEVKYKHLPAITLCETMWFKRKFICQRMTRYLN